MQPSSEAPKRGVGGCILESEKPAARLLLLAFQALLQAPGPTLALPGPERGAALHRSAGPGDCTLREEHAQPRVTVRPSDRTTRCDHRHLTVRTPALRGGYGEGWCSCLQRGKLRLRGPGTVVQGTWHKCDGEASNRGSLSLRRGRQGRGSLPAPGAAATPACVAGWA